MNDSDLEEQTTKLLEAIEAENYNSIQTLVKKINELKPENFHLDSNLFKKANIQSLSDKKIQFDNSIFIFDFIIEGLEIAGASFNNCTFKKSFTLKNLSCSGSIKFNNCQFYNDCIIEGTKTPSYNFSSNNFHNKNLYFVNLTSKPSIHIAKNGGVNKFLLKNFDLEKLILTSNHNESALDCKEFNLERINTKTINLNSAITINKGFKFLDCNLEEVVVNGVKLPNSHSKLECFIEKGTYKSLSLSGLNMSNLTLSNFSTSKILQINMQSDNTTILNIRGVNTKESILNINGRHENFEVNGLINFKEVIFAKNFYFNSDVNIANITASKLTFSEGTSNNAYYHNLCLNNLYGSDSYISFLRLPIELVFNGIQFNKNLNIRDSYVGESHWIESLLKRNLDFSRVKFKVVPRLHSTNFTEACHVSFVSCKFQDFGNMH